MLTSDINAISNAAVNKADVCNNQFGKYLVRSIMAGFYIVVATILSHVTAAVLFPTFPQFGKVLSSLLFSIAIVLIVFIGGELFTGNNLTMAIGYYNSKCSFWDMCKVWLCREFPGSIFLFLYFCEKRGFPGNINGLLQQFYLWKNRAYAGGDGAAGYFM